MTDTKATGALAVQVGGGHYKDLKIQPIEYIHANNLPFIEGSVVKYITRWRNKGGVKDLEKIKHFIDLLIDLEGKGKAAPPTDTPSAKPGPWVPWKGGACPVGSHCTVDAEFRGGEVNRMLAGDLSAAELPCV